MLRLFFLQLCFILFPDFLFGQIIFQDNYPYSDSTEIRLIYREALKIWNLQDTLGYVVGRLDILETTNGKYLLPDGKSDVFKWIDNKWVNLYKGVHHGFNYQSKKFIWRDNIYSIGGYGFWSSNGLVIKFLPEAGEWEMLEFTQSLDGGAPYIKGDSIVVMENGLQTIINLASENLTTGDAVPALSKVKYEGFYFYECKNYAFAIGKTRVLINKKTDQIYTSHVIVPFQMFTKGFAKYRSFIHFQEDQIKVYFINGGSSETEYVEREKQHFKLVSESNISNQWIYYLAATMILIIIPLGSFKLRRKFYKRKGEIEISGKDGFKNDFIFKLNEFNGKTLTMSELDIILGIDVISNPDNQKYQRMLLLKEINSEYEHKTSKVLIIREKDPSDGRRFLYRVEF